MTDEVLARIDASPARRFFGVGVLVLLAVAVGNIAMMPDSASFGRRIPLFAVAAVLVFGAWSMSKATALGLEYTAQGLRDSSGRMIAPEALILSVDRGTFAFKPSNGFVLRLSSAPGLMFRPGLYWRIGKRAGIGGVLRGAETRAMADMITLRLMERDSAAAQAGNDPAS
ncbi:hypothetical protein [Pseudooceanicola algae]|uniref:Uncharacterized protein n=1 Tax=Pseudooceanicola algae TaxID=1537215 RepID=A0A418SFM2_9RHOB|nr:hypothetical protein [Pseudooceanicola algae]QPM89188.1 hypothetical protein PSAL_004010 [Pseudooceanicola algae]